MKKIVKITTFASLLFLICFCNSRLNAADVADLKQAKKEAFRNTIFNTLMAPTSFTAGMIGANQLAYRGMELEKMLIGSQLGSTKRMAARSLLASASGTAVGTFGLTGYFLWQALKSLRDFVVSGALINIEGAKSSK